MEFTNEKIDDCYVVAVSGRLDATTAGKFEEQCDKWLSQDQLHIVVDMGQVEYISSAGLRSILTSAKKLRAKGGDLLFCELKGMVAEVFKMSGFAAMFKISETREQAISN